MKERRNTVWHVAQASPCASTTGDVAQLSRVSNKHHLQEVARMSEHTSKLQRTW